jgi:hypothetical protein
MPEPPDFEQIAREVYDICTLQSLADRFRQVWNARGAADWRAAEHAVLYAHSTDDVLLPIAKACALAIMALDR